MNTNAKGSKFELDVWRHLERDGWIVASRRKGPRYAVELPGDLLAWKLGERAMLIECTANKRSAYSDKTPPERDALRKVAANFDAVPVIAWKDGRDIVLLDEVEWP